MLTATDVTIVIPTKGRREQIEKAIKFINHRPMLLVVDQGRTKDDLPDDWPFADTLRVPAGIGISKISDAAFRAVKTSHVLILNDDIDWDKANPKFVEAALDTFNSEFPDGYGVVGLNDCHRKDTIACFALFTKQFYLDHLDYTVYQHYAGDNEMTDKAKLLGKFAYCETAVLPHNYAGGTGLGTEVMQSDHSILRNRMAEFRKTHQQDNTVFVAVPIYGSIDPHFFGCMVKVLQEMPVRGGFRPFVGDSLVPRARNVLSREFLESPFSHILFIDSDLIFSKDHISRIMQHKEDIVGGFYPKKKQGDVQYVCNYIDGAEDRSDGLLQTRYMGSGFLRISRRVFEAMIEHYGKHIQYFCDSNESQVEHDFWSVGVYQHLPSPCESIFPLTKPRYLSEDWYFCQRAMDLGFKVYGDRNIFLGHSGRCVYPLETQQSQIYPQGVPIRGGK